MLLSQKLSFNERTNQITEVEIQIQIQISDKLIKVGFIKNFKILHKKKFGTSFIIL
jgi:hypothetical protein